MSTEILRASSSFLISRRGESCAIMSFSNGDLRRFQEQLARERNARTLNLRRSSRTLVSSLTSWGSQRRLIDTTQYPILDPETATEVLNTVNLSQIAVLTQHLIEFAQSSPKMLGILLHSAPFIEALSQSVGNVTDIGTLLGLLQAISAVFPLCGDMCAALTDGICFAMIGLLECPNPIVVEATMDLMATMSTHSDYARNAVLCMGLHNYIIEYARQGHFAEKCSHILYRIFATPGTVEAEYMIETSPAICELIRGGSAESATYLIDCLVEMTNKHASLVFTLYDLGVFSLVVELCTNPAVAGPCLRLIGNLSVGQPSQISAMIEAGLLPILFGFIESEYASDAFWILSNLLGTIPSIITPLITSEFVGRVIEIISTSGYDVQKEAAYFLASLICMSNESILSEFIVPEVIEVLVNMIACGVSLVVWMCIVTLLKFCKYVIQDSGKRDELLSLLTDFGLRDRIDEQLDDQEEVMLRNVAQLLSNHMDMLGI